MKFALSLLFFGTFAFAQSPSNYLNDRNESHLCGPFQIEAIEKDKQKFAMEKEQKLQAEALKVQELE